MKKTLGSILLLVIALGAYFLHQEYSVFQFNNSTHQVPESVREQEDEISQLFRMLANETQIDFSDSVAADFDWRTFEGVQTISGKKTTAHVAFDQTLTLDSFFSQQGFDMDMYNMADGTVASLAGFTKDALACTVNIRGEYEEFTMPTESSMATVEIHCGLLATEVEPQVVINTDADNPLAMVSVNDDGVGVKLYTKQVGDREYVDYFLIEKAGIDPVRVQVNEQGLAEEMSIAGYVLQYSNHTDTSVDLTVIAPDGSRQEKKGVAIGSAQVSSHSFSLVPTAYASDEFNDATEMRDLLEREDQEQHARGDHLDGKYYFEVVGTAWNGIACAGGLLTSIIPNPVSATAAVIGCGQLISRTLPTFGVIEGCEDASVFDCVTGTATSLIMPTSSVYLRGRVSDTTGEHMLPDTEITLTHKTGSEKKTQSQKYGIYGDDASLPLEKNGSYTLEFSHPEFQPRSFQLVMSDQRIKIVDSKTGTSVLDVEHTEDALISLDVQLSLSGAFFAEISTRDAANTTAGINGDFKGEIEIIAEGAGMYSCTWNLAGQIDYQESRYVGMHGSVNARSTSCSGAEQDDGTIKLTGTINGDEPLPDGLTVEQFNSPAFEMMHGTVGPIKDLGFQISLEQKSDAMHGVILVPRTSFQGKATEGNEAIGSAIRLKRGLNEGIRFIAVPK